MTNRNLPVVAAIPAYNEEQSLGILLDQVLEQEYDDVYVLDDNSIDNTIELAMSYLPNVKIIKGKENLGSGGNRNRIIGALGSAAIIHFIDGDVMINSRYSPDIARELIVSNEVGYVGGLIRNADGNQMPWNYGPAFSLPQIVSSWLYAGLIEQSKKDPNSAKKGRQFANHWNLIDQWPDTSKEPKAKAVAWSAEANLVTSSKIFERLGGFDERLRYHETLDYSFRLAKIGLKRYFDPSLDVTHKESIGSTNKKAFSSGSVKAMALIALKMGLKDFLIPRNDN